MSEPCTVLPLAAPAPLPRCRGEQRRTSCPDSARDGVRLHPAELDRLDSLASYGVLDTPQESAYDALTGLAARLCGTPFAAVTLVDGERQWFESQQGTSRVRLVVGDMPGSSCRGSVEGTVRDRRTHRGSAAGLAGSGAA